MMKRLLTVAAIALLAVPVVQAQNTGIPNPAATRREQALERREAAAARRDAMRERRAAMTPEQREAARARRADRTGNLTAGQQQFRTDMRAYQRSLRDKAAELRGQVKAGTISRDDMATQLRAYRAANRPARPAAAKPAASTP